MATPERAVCDIIIRFEDAETLASLEDLMFDFMRFDECDIIDLRVDRISAYAEFYRCANVRLLERFLRKEARTGRIRNSCIGGSRRSWWLDIRRKSSPYKGSNEDEVNRGLPRLEV